LRLIEGVAQEIEYRGCPNRNNVFVERLQCAGENWLLYVRYWLRVCENSLQRQGRTIETLGL
jgi:hypothetical protein